MSPLLPAHLVSRPRVDALLDAAVEHLVTVVTADAGSGKTVAVTDWAHRRPFEKLWWHADAETSAGGELPTPGAEPLVVVWEVEQPDAESLARWERLLRVRDGSLRLVIVTRGEATMPELDRLRLGGHVGHLAPHDLAFTNDETQQLLRALGAQVDDDTAARIRADTEGWATGIVLAGLSRAEQANPGELRAAARATARRVLARGEVRRALAYAVSGRDFELAAQIAATGWLELMQGGELDDLAPLLSEIPAERAAGDAELGTALAALSLQLEPHHRAAQRLGALRDSMGGGTRSTSISAHILDLLVARSTGDAAGMRRAGSRLLDGVASAPSTSSELRSLVLSLVGAAETWTGAIEAARTHLRAAVWAADESGSEWLHFVATGFLADAEAKCGDISGALRHVEQTLATARAHGWLETSSAGAAAVIGALIATLQCRFTLAAELVAIAEGATRRPRDHPERAAIALPRLVLLIADGRVVDALDEVQHARSSLGAWPADPIVVDTLRAWEARLLAATGSAPDDVLDAEPRGPLVGATIARFCLDKGDIPGALRAVDAARASAIPLFPSVEIDIELVHALVLRAAHLDAESRAHLERALDIADPAGFLRPLVSHGLLLASALEQHRHVSKHGAFIDEALDMMWPPRAVVPGPVVSLSSRERQVLGFLPSSLSNEDIARALFLSVNTIKTHTRAIYRKLGVDNRRAAVARASELRLLAAPDVAGLELRTPAR